MWALPIHCYYSNIHDLHYNHEYGGCISFQVLLYLFDTSTKGREQCVWPSCYKLTKNF